MPKRDSKKLRLGAILHKMQRSNSHGSRLVCTERAQKPNASAISMKGNYDEEL